MPLTQVKLSRGWLPAVTVSSGVAFFAGGIAFLVAQLEVLAPYKVRIETYSSLVIVTAMAFSMATLWRQKVPLRHWGSVLDPRERPTAYALCMGFLTCFFGSMAAFGWFRLTFPQ